MRFIATRFIFGQGFCGLLEHPLLCEKSYLFKFLVHTQTVTAENLSYRTSNRTHGWKWNKRIARWPVCSETEPRSAPCLFENEVVVALSAKFGQIGPLSNRASRGA